jgi:hypothetical protein
LRVFGLYDCILVFPGLGWKLTRFVVSGFSLGEMLVLLGMGT